MPNQMDNKLQTWTVSGGISTNTVGGSRLLSLDTALILNRFTYVIHVGISGVSTSVIECVACFVIQNLYDVSIRGSSTDWDGLLMPKYLWILT